MLFGSILYNFSFDFHVRLYTFPADVITYHVIFNSKIVNIKEEDMIIYIKTLTHKA